MRLRAEQVQVGGFVYNPVKATWKKVVDVFPSFEDEAAVVLLFEDGWVELPKGLIVVQQDTENGSQSSFELVKSESGKRTEVTLDIRPPNRDTLQEVPRLQTWEYGNIKGNTLGRKGKK